MLGSNNNQNGNNKYEPSYYPRLGWKNDGDRLRLSPTYWKGSLKLSITEVKGMGDTSRAEDLAYIHLSPVKAMTIANYVRKCIDEPESTQAMGVNTGVSDTQGLFVIAREETGRPYIIIAKIDKEGNYVQSQRFNFNHDYHYGLMIEDLNNLSFSKEYRNDIELEQLYELLVDFARSANGAMAASVWDISRYDALKTINQIADKIGARPSKGNGNGGSANDSFFNGNGNTSNSNSGSLSSGSKSGGYTSGSINDLDNEFDD